MVTSQEGYYILRLKVKARRGGQRACRKQVEEESMKVGLRRKDALRHSKWCVGVNNIAAGLW